MTRGGNGDVTPLDVDRRKDIVEQIVDNLRPFKDGIIVAEATAEAEVTAYVNKTLDMLLKYDPEKKKPFDRSLNRKHAKQLDTALTRVQELLSAPSALKTHLRFGLSPWMKDEAGGYTEDEERAWEDEERACREREDFFFAELNRLRKMCALAIDPGIGFHANYGHEQEECAGSAYLLMVLYSKRKITGTQDGAFRTIASLLYKAVFGQPTDDDDEITGLQRACKAVLGTRWRGPDV